MPHSYPELTVKENLRIVAAMRDVHDCRAVEETLETLGLSHYADKKAGKLSLGNAQRLGLAKALVHAPEVLILDEPANSLDPAGIVEIRELLIDLAATHSATVFVSSHILDEVARLANRIGIIHNGRLMREVTAKELHALRARHLCVTTRNNAGAREVLAANGYSVGDHNSGTLELTDEAALANPETVSTVLVNAGVPPVSLYEKEDDLERFFLKSIGGREANHA
jgi:ABC-2 type transport system ATP-binding protein